ncbi:MAG TPA: ATP synthase F0 subunit B [Myxococcota bacterium]|jgi:F-type H+-transporting ATPase subunit b|nr:ATP synthase F0 subunit B [Myxococcota bacterium]
MHAWIVLGARGWLPALASGGSVVDLDGTFFVQLGIFLCVWIVLARGWFRPVLKVLESRRERTEGALARATTLERESDLWGAQCDARIAATRAEAAEARIGLLVDAEAREREVFEQAEKAARGRIAQARDRIQGEVERARKELAPRARELAMDLAGKVLGRRVA